MPGGAIAAGQGDGRSLAEWVESENRHRRHMPDRYAIGRAVARVRVASTVAGVAGDRLSVGDVADRLGRSKRHYQTALTPLTPNRAGDRVAGWWSPPRGAVAGRGTMPRACPSPGKE